MIRYDEEENVKPNTNKKLVLGLIIMFLGAILLADNFNMLPYGLKSIIFTWQMLLIAIGCLNLFNRKGYLGGLIMILIGLFFLIPQIHLFSFDFTRLFWPTLLIAIGILIIFRRNISGSHHKHFQCKNSSTTTKDGFIDDINIFGGSKKQNLSQNFCGGKVTAVFGGSEIDLSRAKLAEGTSVLDMVCIFGGTVIMVPSDWHVRTEVVSILGGFADKRHNLPSTPVDKDRELIIKGVTIFGGGEIKSF
jgi:predicted membrane protein